MRLPLLLLVFGALLAGCATSDPMSRREVEDYWEKAIEDTPLPDDAARVTVERFVFEQATGEGFDIAGRYRRPGVIVPASRSGAAAGLSIFAARDELRGRLRVRAERAERSEHTEQRLALTEGGSAGIAAIRSYPVVQRVVLPVYHGALVVDTIERQVVGSGFTATVHGVEPDGVDVELTPYFRGADEDEVIHVKSLSMRAMLRRGVPYVIMAEDTEEAEVAQTLLSWRSEQSRRRVVMMVTVE
jgi:hypothetical protein